MRAMSDVKADLWRCPQNEAGCCKRGPKSLKAGSKIIEHLKQLEVEKIDLSLKLKKADLWQTHHGFEMYEQSCFGRLKTKMD